MIGGGGSGWGYWPGAGVYSNPHNGGSDEALEYQQCFAEDYADFVENRQGICRDAEVKARSATNALFSATLACVATRRAGPLGAMVCANEFMDYVNTHNDMLATANQCVAQYTPPTHC